MWRRGLRLLGVLALAVAAAAPAAAEGVVPRLERRVGEWMDDVRPPGLALALVDGGRPVYVRGFGLADRSTGRSVDRDTLFQVGSTTKALTALLAAMLEVEGTLRLSDPLRDHLPAELLTAAGVGEVTLAELATHTSGFPRQPPTLRRAHDDYPVLAFTHFELAKSLERTPIAEDRGTRFVYSNYGYAVLGHVLERVTGEPYETLLRTRLFEPLGMDSSTVTLWPHLAARLARPYYRAADGTLEDYTPWDMEALAPAGGAASTLKDMTRLLRALLTLDDDGPLPRSLVEKAIAPRVDLGAGRAYALGWMVEPFGEGGTLVHHGGEVDGYSAYVAFHPRQRTGIVLLTNTGDAPLEPLGRWALLQLARPDPPASREQPGG